MQADGGAGLVGVGEVGRYGVRPHAVEDGEGARVRRVLDQHPVPGAQQRPGGEIHALLGAAGDQYVSAEQRAQIIGSIK